MKILKGITYFLLIIILIIFCLYSYSLYKLSNVTIDTHDTDRDEYLRLKEKDKFYEHRRRESEYYRRQYESLSRKQRELERELDYKEHQQDRTYYDKVYYNRVRE